MTGVHGWIPASLALRVAQRMRDRRIELGMTQRDLAFRVGVAHSSFAHWERGRLPATMAVATLKALEAALQAPQGWLLHPETQLLPDPLFHAANGAVPEGAGDGQMRIPLAQCREIGPHARRLRAELGLTAAEVAGACHVSCPTLSGWERGTFAKALTERRLHAWERALLLAPGQLLAPPALHPKVHHGRWRVLIEAETLEVAIRRVAECLATRGRCLLKPEQPLDPQAARDADLVAHRYGVGAHRWPLADVAGAYATSLSHAHKIVARTIARRAQFEFEIPVLDALVESDETGISSTIARTGDRLRDLLGSALSMECAVAFAGEILCRRIDGADFHVAGADQRAG
jgi:transcriptional regulator with XRE-family HTH domain